MEADKVFYWQSYANCKTVPSSVFFEDERKTAGIPHSKTAYKFYCGNCPVRGLCLDDAIVYQYSGIWGGMTEAERVKKFSKEYREQLIEERKECGDYVDLPATG